MVAEAQRLPSRGGDPLATCRGDPPLRSRPQGVGNTLAYPAAEEGPRRPVALLWRGASRLLCSRLEDRPARRRWARTLHGRRRAHRARPRDWVGWPWGLAAC